MINLTKEQQDQYDKIMGKVDSEENKEKLSDHVVNLSKCIVNLSKKSNVDLGGQVARVVVALDYSGSMSTLYRNGTIQETLNKLIPLGLSFDDNGEVEVYLFEDYYRKFKSMTIENYATYKKDVIDNSSYDMGGTNYAPVLEAIMQDTVYKDKETKKKNGGGFFKKLFGGKEKKPTLEEMGVPADTNTSNIVFVVFITDGDNYDKQETDKIIRESSKTDMFIQFIGIGDSSFKYLMQVDHLSGRACDNTGFTNLQDLEETSDEKLYDIILGQFSEWLKLKTGDKK